MYESWECKNKAAFGPTRYILSGKIHTPYSGACLSRHKLVKTLPACELIDATDTSDNTRIGTTLGDNIPDPSAETGDDRSNESSSRGHAAKHSRNPSLRDGLTASLQCCESQPVYRPYFVPVTCLKPPRALILESTSPTSSFRPERCTLCGVFERLHVVHTCSTTPQERVPRGEKTVRDTIAGQAHTCVERLALPSTLQLCCSRRSAVIPPDNLRAPLRDIYHGVQQRRLHLPLLLSRDRTHWLDLPSILRVLAPHCQGPTREGGECVALLLPLPREKGSKREREREKTGEVGVIERDIDQGRKASNVALCPNAFFFWGKRALCATGRQQPAPFPRSSSCRRFS